MPSAPKRAGFDRSGHIVIAFPSPQSAVAAARALSGIGLKGDAVRHLSDREMVEQIDGEAAGGEAPVATDPPARQRQTQRQLARMGYHWLVVHAPDVELAVQVAQVAAEHGAARAQSDRSVD